MDKLLREIKKLQKQIDDLDSRLNAHIDFIEKVTDDFIKEVHDQDLREIIKNETEDIRNLILAKAFSKLDIKDE